MIRLRYTLSSEERLQQELANSAARAQQAGFDHVCVHQIGPDRERFIRFYEREILPAPVST